MNAQFTKSARFLLSIVAALVLATSVAAPHAEAARGWCKVDPVILVDGQLADIYVGSTLEMLASATGPIKIEVLIPKGSKGAVILTDLGFLRGYKITFVQTSKLTRTKKHTQIQVRVYAPSKKSLPVTVTFAPRSLGSSLKDILFGTSVDGWSNSWVTLTTK